MNNCFHDNYYCYDDDDYLNYVYNIIVEYLNN